MFTSNLSPRQRNEKYIMTHFLKEYEVVDKLPGKTWSEKLYMFEHGMVATPKCICCGDDVTFNERMRKYNNFCSRKCANKYNGQYLHNNMESARVVLAKKYGERGPLGHDFIRKKSSNTKLKRYGDSSFNNYEKTRETLLRKYGSVKRAYKEFHSRTQKTNQEKYGCNWFVETKKFKKQLQESNIKTHDFLIGYTKDDEWICKCPHPGCNGCKEMTYIINPKLYNSRHFSHTELCTKLLPPQPQWSSLEVKIRQWLSEMGIEYKVNDRQFGLEMDIYIPDLKLAIEVNGSYWHSTQHKTSSYHINKSLLLSDHGIRCIFVWDDYEETDIESFLRAVIKDEDLDPWIEKWFPDIKGWPADFGLIEGQWQEHECTHNEFECYDAGIIKQ